MVDHHHLFPLDPNLIIRLLHTNINYNYFSFAHLFFQQIKGTSMGASFSPTIANIFMSHILRGFLNQQKIKPTILTRYIDDIFLIWPDTLENLTTFLRDLNSFHPSLHFTFKHSSSTIDFLDLTIYKGDQFHFSNILDTKTFQKPLNLFQYLHFNSEHPIATFKAIIKGECVRYVRTNTRHETYIATVQLFKQRLTKRGYPPHFTEKIVNTVKYCERQKHLKRHNLHPATHTFPPPLFKCVPPPQYKLLKKIVLKNYHELNFITPRFVTMKHPTLHNALVRASLKPTNEQIIDMELTLSNTKESNHHTMANPPNISTTMPTISPCHQPQCLTCRHHLICKQTFQSTHPRKRTIYRIRHSFTCKSANLIYLLSCSKCKKQYVGCTTRQLNIRTNHHRTSIRNQLPIHAANHFNQPNHFINLHLKVQPIDCVQSKENNNEELYRLERYWIQQLRTLTPHGLNVSRGRRDKEPL